MTTRTSLLVVALLLTACGGRGPRGEYADESGMFTYNFKSGGKVAAQTKVFGTIQEQELDYEVEDGKVKIGPSGGPKQVASIDANGCLDVGGLVGKLCKKK